MEKYITHNNSHPIPFIRTCNKKIGKIYNKCITNHLGNNTERLRCRWFSLSITFTTIENIFQTKPALKTKYKISSLFFTLAKYIYMWMACAFKLILTTHQTTHPWMSFTSGCLSMYIFFDAICAFVEPTFTQWNNHHRSYLCHRLSWFETIFFIICDF